jgi:transcriptional regulator with XRE-family HTH domain
MPKRLSEKLKQIRVRAGLDQTEMVKALKYKASPLRAAQISHFELGRREPNSLLLLAYARFAGVTTEVLIDDKMSLPRSRKNDRAK